MAKDLLRRLKNILFASVLLTMAFTTHCDLARPFPAGKPVSISCHLVSFCVVEAVSFRIACFIDECDVYHFSYSAVYYCSILDFHKRLFAGKTLYLFGFKVTCLSLQLLFCTLLHYEEDSTPFSRMKSTVR